MTTKIDKLSRIIVRTSGGETFKGKPYDVVAQMRAAGLFTAGKTNAEYMRFVGRMVVSMHGRPIRTHAAASFLTDMEAVGELTINRTH